MTTKKIQVTVDPEIGRLKKGAIFRRYLDLPKFVDLLWSSSVYLTRTDLLSDKLEGALTPSIRRAINDAYSNNLTNYNADEFIRISRESSYVNCWSIGANDNMALWHLYSSVYTGVAITSTKEKLIHTCLNWAAKEHVEIFKVKYINHFNNPNMIIGSYTYPLRFKHIAYRYEREVRIVISKIQHNEDDKYRLDGIKLPVELDNFIRSVVVAPEAGSWFFELVSDIAMRYGLNVPVRKSKLAYLLK
jgi:hypothetical protein